MRTREISPLWGLPILCTKWLACGVCCLAMPLLAQTPGQQEQDLVPLPHPQIAPPAVPAEPVSWWFPVAAVLAAIVLAALVLWLLLMRKSPGPAEAVSPLKLALGRLDALKLELERHSPDEVAHRVSVVLRDYLQARYGVPAPYRTTQELYGDSAIQAREGLRERFGPVAEFYDRLEFAPQPATRADSANLIEDAVRALQEEKRYNPSSYPPSLHVLPSAPPPLPTHT
jgi:hypothetical protein